MDTISNFLCVEKMGWSDAYRDMDITQGSLRKAGVPTPIVKRLRKEANKFYRELLKKKSKCTS